MESFQPLAAGEASLLFALLFRALVYLLVCSLGASSSEPSSGPGTVLQSGFQHDAGAEGPRVPPAVRVSGTNGPGWLHAHARPQLPQHGPAAQLRRTPHAAQAGPQAHGPGAEPAKSAATPAAASPPSTAGGCSVGPGEWGGGGGQSGVPRHSVVCPFGGLKSPSVLSERAEAFWDNLTISPLLSALLAPFLSPPPAPLKRRAVLLLFPSSVTS